MSAIKAIERILRECDPANGYRIHNELRELLEWVPFEIEQDLYGIRTPLQNSFRTYGSYGQAEEKAAEKNDALLQRIYGDTHYTLARGAAPPPDGATDLPEDVIRRSRDESTS